MKSVLFAVLLSAFSHPALAGDEEYSEPPPPTVTSRDTLLFSWTKRPAALVNAEAHVASQLARAKDCVNQLERANRSEEFQEVAGCEGDEMAAGPGIYVCDNPFTSHDYGDILLVMKAKPGNPRVANMSGLIRPADGGLDRSVAGNHNYDAVLYDFRANDDGGYAATVRDPKLLDASATKALKVPAGERTEFQLHRPFQCKASTELPEVLAAWGDHLDFLALTYDTRLDPTGEGFTKHGALNHSGFIAALASNAVAVSDVELEKKIAALGKLSPAIKTALSPENCHEGGHRSPRMCLAYELYDSIVGNYGSDRYPRQAWPFKALKPALIELGILDKASAGKLKNRAQLMAFLAKQFQKNPTQAQRAEEAFGCVKLLKAKLAPRGLASWIEPAEKSGTVSAPVPEGGGGVSAR